MTSTAERLAVWAHGYVPTPADHWTRLPRPARHRRGDPRRADRWIRTFNAALPDAARWAAVGHVLDFADLRLGSTAHISVVYVPATLATGGGPEAYLAGAGAGVMARLGSALGWALDTAGWHVTCTAGGPAAAVAASVALGLSEVRTARAVALAVPQAGGVQRAFGTDGKASQVGMAAEAGVRAARLAAAGATTDLTALDQWLALVGGDPDAVDQPGAVRAPNAVRDLGGPAIPGGLAVKLFPCCYTLQRPIAAIREAGLTADGVRRIAVRTSAAGVQPLIHHRPVTRLQGKFSLEYAIAVALLGGHPGFAFFTDEAVTRPATRHLLSLVDTTLEPGGSGLLDGRVEIELTGGEDSRRVASALPPGAPDRPPTGAQLREKQVACGADDLSTPDWNDAAALLAKEVPAG
jgi:2-methylcitrate dehydratase PrpD